MDEEAESEKNHVVGETISEIREEGDPHLSVPPPSEHEKDRRQEIVTPNPMDPCHLTTPQPVRL
jgi:hypothetical protein